MGCEVNRSWTLPALVGAFVDLAVAYFLLCASASAFLADNFLRCFGLRLPCPCDGFFGFPAGPNCLHRLLIAESGERVAAVQRTVKEKLPFSAVSASGEARVKQLPDADGGGGGLRPRRGGGGCRSSSVIEEVESSVSSSSDDERIQCDAESKRSHGLRKGRLSLTQNDRMSLDRVSHPDEGQIPAFEIFRIDPDVNQTQMIKVLEQALEVEKAARAALYLDLERERNAAASAADEAMGMIYRLQQEKASIEMESRQFQRMIEEKSAYDEEEMRILNEILWRREREKLVLENELEAFRKVMALEGGTADMTERLYDAGHDEHSGLLGNSSLCENDNNGADDPSIILQQICESIDKKGAVKGFQICLDNSPTGRNQGGFKILPFDFTNSRSEGEASDNCVLQSSGDVASSFFFEEKNIISTDGLENGHQNELNTCVSKHGHQLDTDTELHLASKVADLLKPENSTQVDSCECSSLQIAQAEVASSVFDVYAVDDISKSCSVNAFDRKESYVKPIMSNESNNLVNVEESIHRSKSDFVGTMLEEGELKDKTSFSAYRRNSLSAVDDEKCKINSEVGWLTERLKLVQKGRQRLSSSLEIKEMLSQVKDAQSINSLKSNARRIFSTPPLSKAFLDLLRRKPVQLVKSNKRRCRTASLHESAD